MGIVKIKACVRFLELRFSSILQKFQNRCSVKICAVIGCSYFLQLIRSQYSVDNVARTASPTSRYIYFIAEKGCKTSFNWRYHKFRPRFLAYKAIRMSSVVLGMLSFTDGGLAAGFDFGFSRQWDGMLGHQPSLDVLIFCNSSEVSIPSTMWPGQYRQPAGTYTSLRRKAVKRALIGVTTSLGPVFLHIKQ